MLLSSCLQIVHNKGCYTQEILQEAKPYMQIIDLYLLCPTYHTHRAAWPNSCPNMETINKQGGDSKLATYVSSTFWLLVGYKTSKQCVAQS